MNLKTFAHSTELENFLRACNRNGVVPTRFVLVVSVANQTVSLFEKVRSSAFRRSEPAKAGTPNEYRIVQLIRCSTSRFGAGQKEGSNCTPLGLHRIAKKIGAGKPAGTVFKSRKVIGHVSQPELAGAKITTRILWLEGLEPGFNRGGNVDSHARYIYIHGTGDETTIGRPASCGCIHLAANDLIPLFDKLPVGTLVWIDKR
ncbi:MAG: L,D-transpeptidase [Verrucomicrobiia bacterium]